MIALDTARVRDALAPLHAELLRRADVEADRIMADANAEARDVLDRAESEAQRIIDSARAAGAAEASMAQAAERARTRRAHQSDVLAAQRTAYEQLRRRATDAVHRFATSRVTRGCASGWRQEQPTFSAPTPSSPEDSAGGIVAEAAGRRLDLSLAAFAARAFERIEADIDGLWS